MEIMPPKKIPMDYYSVFIADAYYKAGGGEKGNEVMSILINKHISEIEWFIDQKGHVADKLTKEVRQNLQYLQNIKYFLGGNLKLLEFTNSPALAGAEELEKTISDFEESNQGAITRFMNRDEKSRKRSRN